MYSKLIEAGVKAHRQVESDQCNDQGIKGLLFFEAFEENARERPGHIALIYRTREWTYQELNENANRIAHALLTLKTEQGWSYGDCIAIFFENCPDAIVTILGIMKAGLAYVPLTVSEKLKLQHLKYYFDTSKAKLIIVQDKLHDHEFVKSMEVNKVNLYSKLINIQFTASSAAIALDQDNDISIENPKHTHPICRDQLAYIIFSSGSTGQPKGIKIAHRGLMSPVKAIRDIFDIKPNHRVGWYSLLTFDASLIDIMTALGSGASLVIVPNDVREDYEKLTKYLADNKVNFITLVPSVLSKLKPEKLSCLDGYISTGERAYKKIFENWQTMGRQQGQLPRKGINGYGPTEVSGVTSVVEYDPDTEDTHDDVPLGEKPIGGLEWFVLQLPAENDPYPDSPQMVQKNEDGKLIGELYISGTGVGLGYVDENASYKKRYRLIRHPDPAIDKQIEIYQTGDKVEQLIDGKIIFRGRIDGDKQYKYLGELIEPDAIALNIQSYKKGNASIFNHVLVSVETLDGNSHSLPVLRVYLESQQAVDAQLIRRVCFYLRHNPKSYCTFIPSRFSVFANKWPVNSNDKLETDAKKFINETLVTIYPTHPLNLKIGIDVEKKIAKVWEKVLGIREENLDLDSNFFELGGDSPRVNWMFSLLKGEFENFERNFIQFYTCPTIRALAFRISNHLQENNHTTKPVNLKNFKIAIRKKKCPIILVNSVTGDSETEYTNIVNFLSEHPLLLTEPLSLSEPGYIVSSLDELASDYLRSINDFLSDYDYSGPLFFVGYSAAGTLVYEMARQLKIRDNQRRVMVCLVDTLSPLYYQKLSSVLYAEEIKKLMINVCKAMIPPLDIDPKDIERIIGSLSEYEKKNQLKIFCQEILEKIAANDESDRNRYLGYMATLYNLVQTQLTYNPGSIENVALLAFTGTEKKCGHQTLHWENMPAPVGIIGEHGDFADIRKAIWVKDDVIPEILKFYNSFVVKNPYQQQAVIVGPAQPQLGSSIWSMWSSAKKSMHLSDMGMPLGMFGLYLSGIVSRVPGHNPSVYLTLRAFGLLAFASSGLKRAFSISRFLLERLNFTNNLLDNNHNNEAQSLISAPKTGVNR